jgi:hypothetical protein
LSGDTAFGPYNVLTGHWRHSWNWSGFGGNDCCTKVVALAPTSFVRLYGIHEYFARSILVFTLQCFRRARSESRHSRFIHSKFGRPALKNTKIRIRENKKGIDPNRRGTRMQRRRSCIRMEEEPKRPGIWNPEIRDSECGANKSVCLAWLSWYS